MRSSLLIQSFFSTGLSGHRAHPYTSRGIFFSFWLGRPAVQQAYTCFKKKKFQKGAGSSRCAFAARVSLDTLTKNWMHAIDVRGVNIICRLGTKKSERKKSSAGHRGRRWHGAYCIHHSTKFFSYKVFDFGDLNADAFILRSCIRVLTMCSVGVDGKSGSKNRKKMN